MALRVLVVDDSADTADSSAVLLKLWGHDVRVARSGPEAVTVAAEFTPQVALVDLMMPGMNGYEVGRRLSQEQPNIVLIAVTGLAGEEHRRRWQETGFFIRLVKPADPEQLRQLLEALTQPVG